MPKRKLSEATPGLYTANRYKGTISVNPAVLLQEPDVQEQMKRLEEFGKSLTVKTMKNKYFTPEFEQLTSEQQVALILEWLTNHVDETAAAQDILRSDVYDALDILCKEDENA